MTLPSLLTPKYIKLSKAERLQKFTKDFPKCVQKQEIKLVFYVAATIRPIERFIENYPLRLHSINSSEACFHISGLQRYLVAR